MTDHREFLRHTLATLAYRGGKLVRDVPERFGGFRAAPVTRTPLEILAHIADLLSWTSGLCRGDKTWKPAVPDSWDDEVQRFFDALQEVDKALQSDEELGYPPEKLFQGPIADAFTHLGQLAMLRRLAGTPVRSEIYLLADVEIGRVGSNQALPYREFD